MKIYGISVITGILLISLYCLLLISGKVSASTLSVGKGMVIIFSVIFFVLGFLSGNHAQKKGIITGVLYSLIPLLAFFMYSVISKVEFDTKYYIKILIFVLSSALGGRVGVSIKKFI